MESLDGSKRALHLWSLRRDFISHMDNDEDSWRGVIGKPDVNQSGVCGVLFMNVCILCY